MTAPTPPSAMANELSYAELLRLTEGHGTSEIYERIAHALSERDTLQCHKAWTEELDQARQEGREEAQAQLRERDERIGDQENAINCMLADCRRLTTQLRERERELAQRDADLVTYTKDVDRRLRGREWEVERLRGLLLSADEIAAEDAKEVERLRAENEQLRKPITGWPRGPAYFD